MQTIAKPIAKAITTPTLYAYPSKPTPTPKHRLTAIWLKDPQTGHLYCRWI